MRLKTAFIQWTKIKWLEYVLHMEDVGTVKQTICWQMDHRNKQVPESSQRTDRLHTPTSEDH